MSGKLVLIAGLVLLLTACQSQVQMTGAGTNMPGKLAALDKTKGELIANFRVAPPPKSSAFKLAAFDTTGIAKIKLEIIGGALTAPMEKVLDLRANNQLSERFVLPIGKNFVITAYPYNDASELINTEVMYAFFDINPGSQQVNLNWRSSPGGQLLAQLYAMGRKDLAQSLDMVSLQKTIDEMQMKLAALTTVPITDKLTTFKDTTDVNTQTFNRSYKVVDVNQLLTMVVNNNGLPDFTVTPPPEPSLESSKIFVAELKPQVRDPLYAQAAGCDQASAYAIPASRTSTNVFFGKGSGKVSGFMLASEATIRKMDFAAVPSVDTLLGALGGDAARAMVAAPMDAAVMDAAVMDAAVMDAMVFKKADFSVQAAVACTFTNVNAGMMITGGGFSNDFNDGDGDFFDDKGNYQVLINGEKAPVFKWSDEGIAFGPPGFKGLGAEPPTPMPAQAIVSIISPNGITTFAYQANHTIKFGENKKEIPLADNDGDGRFDPVRLNYSITDPAGNAQDYALNWNIYNIDEKGNETWMGNGRYFGVKGKDDPAAFALIDSKGQIWPKQKGNFKVTVSGLNKDPGTVSFYGSVGGAAVAGKTLDMIVGEGAAFDKAKSVDSTTLVQMVKDKGWDPGSVEYRSYNVDTNGKEYLAGSSIGEKTQVEIPVVFAEKDGTLYSKVPGKYIIKVNNPKTGEGLTLSGNVKLNMNQKVQTYAVEVLKNVVNSDANTAGRSVEEFDWQVKQADKIVSVMKGDLPDGSTAFGIFSQGATGAFTITGTHLKDGSTLTFNGEEGTAIPVDKTMEFVWSEGAAFDKAKSVDGTTMVDLLKGKGIDPANVVYRSYTIHNGKEYLAYSTAGEKSEVSNVTLAAEKDGTLYAKQPGEFRVEAKDQKTGAMVNIKGTVVLQMNQKLQNYAVEVLKNVIETHAGTLGRDVKEFTWEVKQADKIVELKEGTLADGSTAYGIFSLGATGTFTITGTHLKDGTVLTFQGREGVAATVAKELKFYFSEGKGYDPAVSEDKSSLPEVLKAKGWGFTDITARAYNVDAISGKEYKAFSYLKEKNEVNFPVVEFSPEGAIAAKAPGKFAIHLLNNKTGEDLVVKGEVFYRLYEPQPWAEQSLRNLVESNPMTLGRDIHEFEWTVENADPVNPAAEYKEPQLVWTNQAGTYRVNAKSLKDGATLSFNGDAIIFIK